MEEMEYELTRLSVVYGVPCYGRIGIVFYFGPRAVYTLHAGSAFDCFFQLRRWLESFAGDMACCGFDWDEGGMLTTICYEQVQTPLSALYQDARLKESVYRFSIVPNRYRCDYRQIFSMFGTARQIVSAFYFPLLRMIMENGFEVSRNWEVPRMQFYAEMKSPVVERFLRSKGSYFAPSLQDTRIVRHILYMMPDYDTLFWDAGDFGPVPAGDCTEVHIEGEETVDLASVGGLWRWYADYIEYFVFGQGNDRSFNWAGWHARGLGLARRVRKLLPCEIDLWYWAPAGDDSGSLKRPLLIGDFNDNGYGDIDG